jgi:hypothetical protein
MGGQKIQAKMSNSNGSETPLQDAVSIITIISILASIGCYVAALNQVPVITPALWVVSLPCVRVFAGAGRSAGCAGADLDGERGRRRRVLCVHDPPLLLAGRSVRPDRVREHGAPDNAAKTLPRET